MTESNPRISMIAAVAANRVIGAKNDLIWRLPEDLKRFKKITSGHPVIMGRNTYLSLGRPLPKRTNIVITSNENFAKEVPEGVIVVNSLMEALVIAPDLDEKEVFIIGGGRVYAEALGFADRLYLTLIDKDFEGDTVFPDWTEQFPTVIEEEAFEEEEMAGKYVILER
jgi:dihydrofolate reductase